jgi:hypothetical protein
VDTTRWQVDTMPAVLDAEGDAPPDGIAVPELQEDEKIQYIKRGVSTFVDTRYCATVIQRSSVPRPCRKRETCSSARAGSRVPRSLLESPLRILCSASLGCRVQIACTAIAALPYARRL